MKNLKTEITKIHYNKQARGIFVKILDFASIFYGLGSRFKNLLYDKSVLHPKHVNAFVISVGNITTGGVGKTPVVAELAKYFISKGKKTAVISRGYGGKLSNKQINIISDGEKIYYNSKLAGDEPFWIAKNVKGVIVITSKNRYLAAKTAVENFGVENIILDDGFQHRKLYRDMDIVLADSEKWFGNEKLLPAGPLREGLEAFSRIDRFIIVSKNTNHTKAEKLSKIMAKKMNVKTLLCRIEPDSIYNIKTGEHLDDSENYTAVCAIGQPEQFYAFLNNCEKTLTFDDHHRYTENEIPKGIIVTTEKDAVKMQDFDRTDIYALKLKTDLDIEQLF